MNIMIYYYQISTFELSQQHIFILFFKGKDSSQKINHGRGRNLLTRQLYVGQTRRAIPKLAALYCCQAIYNLSNSCCLSCQQPCFRNNTRGLVPEECNSCPVGSRRGIKRKYSTTTLDVKIAAHAWVVWVAGWIRPTNENRKRQLHHTNRFQAQAVLLL